MATWFQNQFERLNSEGFKIRRIARTGSNNQFEAVSRSGEVLAVGKENIMNLSKDSDSSNGGGEFGLPGFRAGGPNDPAEGGTGYQGGFSPISGDNTSASNNGGMATSFLVGVIALGYLAYRWWM